jgi:hypothetical protein
MAAAAAAALSAQSPAAAAAGGGAAADAAAADAVLRMTKRERQQRRLQQASQGPLSPRVLRQLVVSELCDAAPYAMKVKLLRQRYESQLLLPQGAGGAGSTSGTAAGSTGTGGTGAGGGQGEGGSGAQVHDVAAVIAHLKQEGRVEAFTARVGKGPGTEWYVRWLDDDWAADLACAMAKHVPAA